MSAARSGVRAQTSVQKQTEESPECLREHLPHATCIQLHHFEHCLGPLNSTRIIPCVLHLVPVTLGHIVLYHGGCLVHCGGSRASLYLLGGSHMPPCNCDDQKYLRHGQMLSRVQNHPHLHFALLTKPCSRLGVRRHESQAHAS